MADKYGLDVRMAFPTANAASELREAAEAAILQGLTTVGDRYNVEITDQTGECTVETTMRFVTKAPRDKVAKAAAAAKASAKPNAQGRIATHVCRHNPANVGYDDCVGLVADEWGRAK